MRRGAGKDDRAAVTFYVLRFTSLRPPLPAFTLVEMLVVIAISAVLATVAAVSLAGTYRAARARDAAGQVAAYDRLTREGARRTGRPARLTFDLDRGTMGRAPAGGDAADDSGGFASLHLAAGLRIERVVWAGGSATAGQVALPCSTRGQTPSYGLLLAGGKGERHWLVVAGLTGRTVAVNDAQEVEDLFKTLAGEPGETTGDAAGRDDAR